MPLGQGPAQDRPRATDSLYTDVCRVQGVYKPVESVFTANG